MYYFSRKSEARGQYNWSTPKYVSLALKKFLFIFCGLFLKLCKRRFNNNDLDSRIIFVKIFNMKESFSWRRNKWRTGREACAKIQSDHLVKHGGLNLKRFMGHQVICFMLVITATPLIPTSLINFLCITALLSSSILMKYPSCVFAFCFAF